MDWFSPAQCVGYVAFVFGVSSFLQMNDRRFKLLMASECAAYVVHFALLGNPTAVASSLVSTLRSVLAIYTRAWWVAAAVVAVNLTLGLALAQRATDWLPLIASCLGTLALFLMQGIPMRLVMLMGTCLWIANNIIAGSLGGTALEIVVAVANISTVLRLYRQSKLPPL